MNEMSPDELCVDEVRTFLLKEVTSRTKRSACFLPKVKHLLVKPKEVKIYLWYRIERIEAIQHSWIIS